MDITKTFLNNFTNSAELLTTRSSALSNGKSNFESFLNSAENSKKSNFATTEKTNYSDNKNSVSKTKNSVGDNKKTENFEQKDNDLNSTQTEVKSSDKDSTKTEVENSETSETEKTETSKSEADNSEINEVVEKIADVLGISTDELQQILSELNMSLKNLQNSDDLLEVVKEVMDVENPIELLAVDGIKDVIVEVKELVSEVDFDSLFENVLNSENVSQEESSPEIVLAEETLVETGTDIVKESAVLSNVVEEDIPEEVIKNNVENENSQIQNSTNLTETSERVSMASNSGNMENQFANTANQEFSENLTSIGNNTTSLDEVSKVFSKTMSRTQSSRNINATDVINQIVEKMKSGLTKENISEIRVTLRPDYLGDVSLKVSSENGIITAQFTAESKRVKEIIESNFNELKEMLNQQGIEVAELSVSVGNQKQNENMQQFMMNQEKSGRRIDQIIADSIDENLEENSDVVNDTVQYVDSGEGTVLETNVNYTA